MNRIVIFASGSGSNALNLIRHFNGGDFAQVVCVLCNKPEAGVIAKAEAESVPVEVFNRHDFYQSNNVIDKVAALKPDIIVLAGFLWLVPTAFIQAFDGKIINLHPSLLPKFGGKGMYGHHVHEAVLAANEKVTGITIHLVNEEFDKGEIIYQDQFEIPENATVSDIEQHIHQLEHRGMPIAVEQFLKRL